MSSEDDVNKTKQDTKKYEEKENVTASYHTCYHTCYRFITRIYTIFSHVTAKATWKHLFLLLFFKLMRKTYNFSSRPHHGIFIVVVFIVRSLKGSLYSTGGKYCYISWNYHLFGK